MIEIGKRDRIFVAVVLPLALLGGYLHFVRQPLAKARGTLAAERAQLPDPDMFPRERRALAGRVAEAERRVEAERKAPAPEPAVRGTDGESEAARQQAVFDALHAKGVRIVSSEAAEAEGVCADALRATGIRPNPVARRLRLESGYAEMLGALKEIGDRRLAVIPAKWSMTPSGATCRWELTLWF